MSRKNFTFAAVIFAVITIIGLSSCKDEVHYSCNPTIDAVIKQNLPYYQGMTRREWKTLPDSLKNAAFVAMTPELKMEFWKGKYNEMMNARFFTDAEKRHISKLYDYLFSINDLFTDESDNSRQKQRIFEYYKEWAFNGVDFLKWDVIDVFLIAENMEELTKDYIEHVKHNAKNNAIPSRKPETQLQNADGSNGTKPNCKCLYDAGCGNGTACDNSKCTETNWGCGIIGFRGCRYLCSDPVSLNGKVVNVVDYANQRELLEYMFRIK